MTNGPMAIGRSQPEHGGMDGLVALAGVGIGFSAVLAAVLIGIAKLTGGSPDA